MRQAILLLATVGALTALPSAAQAATSTISNGAGGEYVLNDDSGEDNSYAVFTDKQTGQWVIFDSKGTIGRGNTACIGRNFEGYSAVYCPPAGSLRINANDGDDTVVFSVTATDKAKPFNGNTKVFGGAGNDGLQGGNQNDELYGQQDNDQFRPGFGNDVVDGGEDFDTDHNEERQQDLIINQDNVADDGAIGTTERDDVRSSVEAVIGGMGNDLLAGADGAPSPDGVAVPALVGWAGKDLIVPGTRSENIVSGGLALPEESGDAVSYGGRRTPVRVSLDGRANDGAVAPDGSSTEKDNVTNGFDLILLGQAGDTYIGPHSSSVPDEQLSDYETSDHRISIRAGTGNDKLYPGSTAEDLHGDEDTDLVSYIRRQPSGLFRQLMHVSLTLDGKANDGQAISLPAVSQTALNYVIFPLALSSIGPSVVIKYGDDGVSAVVTLLHDGLPVSEVLVNWRTVTTTFKNYLNERSVTYQGAAAVDPIIQIEAGASLDPYLPKKVLDEIGAIAAMVERAANGSTVQAGFFGWQPAFSGRGLTTEADDIDDDVEQLQGSTNVAEFEGGVPYDFIQGDDRPNTVLGSPGPDVVEGLGGVDVLNGDSPGYAGSDVLSGGNDPDWIFGNTGSDVLIGGHGQDGVFANDATSYSDGAIDDLACGEALPGEQFDAGPYEGDVTFLDEAGDHDFRSAACKNASGSSDATGSLAAVSGSTLKVSAFKGKVNALKLSSSAGSITVRDAKSPVKAGDGCAATAGRDDQVRCSAAGVSRLQVDSGDLKDSIDLGALQTGSATSIEAGDGNDKVVGSPGNDVINTGAGKDKVKAKNGDDTIDGGTDADVLDGGNGSDTISYATRTAPVDVYLAQPSTKHNGTTSLSLNNFPTHGAGDLEGDTIKWAENVVGGSGADILQGNQLDNTIEGGAGVDAFSSGPGNDVIKARDGVKDGSILCGDGTDRYQIDALDPLSGCEKEL